MLEFWNLEVADLATGDIFKIYRIVNYYFLRGISLAEKELGYQMLLL